MTPDRPDALAPLLCPTCGSDPLNSPHFSLSGDHTDDVCADCYDVVRALAASLKRREELLRAALEWVVNVGCGCSRGGDGPPSQDEIEAALEAGQLALKSPAKPTEAP
jgi:hypothetical protein